MLLRGSARMGRRRHELRRPQRPPTFPSTAAADCVEKVEGSRAAHSSHVRKYTVDPDHPCLRATALPRAVLGRCVRNSRHAGVNNDGAARGHFITHAPVQHTSGRAVDAVKRLSALAFGIMLVGVAAACCSMQCVFASTRQATRIACESHMIITSSAANRACSQASRTRQCPPSAACVARRR